MRSLDKQVELFREGVELAVFNRDYLDDGQVKVILVAGYKAHKFVEKVPKTKFGKISEKPIPYRLSLDVREDC